MESLELQSFMLLGQFHFLRPFWLVALIPAVWIWWCIVRKSNTRSLHTLPIAPHLLKHLIVHSDRRHRIQPSTVLLPAWCLMAVALAGPSWRLHPSPFLQDQSNLWVIVKLTPSMENDDLLPNRLERTRNKIHDLMELRDGSATGLIVYSKSAHLVMPATNDSGVIDQVLQSLDPGMMPGEGDSLSDALQIAFQRAAQEDTPASVLLVSDAVTPEQLSLLSKMEAEIPIQWLVPVSPKTSFDGLGIRQSAGLLQASLIPLTVDDSDVQTIADNANRSLTTSKLDSTSQWIDDGYWLLWPITFIAAMWCRRGWNLGDGVSQ